MPDIPRLCTVRTDTGLDCLTPSWFSTAQLLPAHSLLVYAATGYSAFTLFLPTMTFTDSFTWDIVVVRGWRFLLRLFALRLLPLAWIDSRSCITGCSLLVATRARQPRRLPARTAADYGTFTLYARWVCNDAATPDYGYLPRVFLPAAVQPVLTRGSCRPCWFSYAFTGRPD